MVHHYAPKKSSVDTTFLRYLCFVKTSIKITKLYSQNILSFSVLDKFRVKEIMVPQIFLYPNTLSMTTSETSGLRHLKEANSAKLSLFVIILTIIIVIYPVILFLTWFILCMGSIVHRQTLSASSTQNAQNTHGNALRSHIRSPVLSQ